MRRLILEEGTDHAFLMCFKRLPLYACKHCQAPTLFSRYTAPGKRVCADCRMFKFGKPNWSMYNAHGWGARQVYVPQGEFILLALMPPGLPPR